jgi:cell division septum initiation protein DivIVA
LRIARDQVIADLPAAQLRDAMRKVNTSRFDIDELATHLGTKASDLASRLQAEGYIEPAPHHNALWRTTIQGNALTMAKLGTPYTRKAAEKAVSGMLNAAEQINSGDYLYFVERLEIFGSYLDDSKDRIGDVDVIVTLAPRWTTHKEFTDGVNRRCDAANRRFQIFHQRLTWPEKEVRRALKVSPILSFLESSGVPEEWPRTLVFQRTK